MTEYTESTDKYFSVAIEYQRAGNLPMAESYYKKILSIQPNHTPSIGNLAVIAKKLGNYDLAIKLLRKLTRLNPQDEKVYNTLGNIYHERGDTQKAIQYYKLALQMNPDYVSTYANLGIVYQLVGDTNRAIYYLKRGLQIDITSNNLNFCLANVYHQRGQFQLAVQFYQRVLQTDQHHAQTYSNLALSLKSLRQYDLAIYNLKRAIEIAPESSNVYYNLGNIYREVGQYRKAIECHQKAIQLEPNSSKAYINLGILLGDLERYDEAIKYLKKALQLTPSDSDAYYNLGNILAEILDYKQSNHFYHMAIELRSGQAINNYLMNLNYVDQIDPQFVFDEHQTKAKKLQMHWSPHESLVFKVSDDLSYNKIRIGYLSSDFREHSVAYFFQSVIQHHNRDQFEIFCFFNSDVEDKITSEIRHLSDHFISIYHLSDAMAFEEIRRHNLHFLVELNGHTNGNRLAILRSGLADKILSWIGYPNTTGLASVDYKISDNYCDPAPFADRFYVEELLRLDTFFMVYKQPESLPPIKQSPYLTNNHLTFGSFNNFKKINSSLICLWSEVLEAFANSRLILKNSSKTNSRQKEFFLKNFQQAGIDCSRIDFFEKIEDQKEHLELYNLVDISLDTHPYSGTTTTFESLIMGVPVFTLVGQFHVHASRVTGSILNQMKLDQFIVNDRKNYVRQLKETTQKEQNLDRTYRQRLLKSNLCDGPAFTKRFEEKLKSIL